jgi:hypothetical protein
MLSAGQPSVRSCRVTASQPRLVSQNTCTAAAAAFTLAMQQRRAACGTLLMSSCAAST